MHVAPKALLKVVRYNCKMGCDTLRCSCPKAELECSTGCGESRGISANMYDNITKDNEYEEDTYVVMLSRMIPHSCIALIGTIRLLNIVVMAAILNFRELFWPDMYDLVTE